MDFMDVYRAKRQYVFTKIDEAGFSYKLSLSFLFACLTGIGAMLRLYTPFTPVPITMQVFFVLLSGALLGKYYGGLSQAMYAFLGFAGIPWFTHPSAIFGITGGYIIGFVFASFAVGLARERVKTKIAFAISMMLGVTIIYAFGAFQFSLIMKTGIYETVMMAILPFIAIDFVKAIGASAASFLIMPESQRR